MTTKKDGDSLYWVVEKMAAKVGQKVAESHAKRGGRTVLFTGRKIPADERADMEAAGIEVLPIR